MKYLKEFNSSSDYEDFVVEEIIDKPSVYYLANEKEVIYNQEKKLFIDLGLPSGNLWATEPIKNDNDEVLYFAWGEVSGYTASQVGVDKNFELSDYEWYDQEIEEYTKYNYDHDDNDSELYDEDDAVKQILGESFKTPSYNDYVELVDNCIITLKWINSYDENNNEHSYPVYVFKSKINGKQLTLGCYGYCRNEGQYDYDPYYYMGLVSMVNSIHSEINCWVFTVQVDYDEANVENEHLKVFPYDNISGNYRYLGYPIFPVKVRNIGLDNLVE